MRKKDVLVIMVRATMKIKVGYGYSDEFLMEVGGLI